jgi:hypothetical protein
MKALIGRVVHRKAEVVRVLPTFALATDTFHAHGHKHEATTGTSFDVGITKNIERFRLVAGRNRLYSASCCSDGRWDSGDARLEQPIALQR